MGASTKVVASQIIPLANENLILPNTAVAEIIGHTKADALPSAIKNAPDWLIGLLTWRGVSVPLLSLDTMLGGKTGEAGAKARIAILNGISEEKKVPFFAIATQGIPRLMKIDSEHISTVDDAESNPAVICHVVVDGDVAIIPDIEYIEGEVARVFSAGRPGGGSTDNKNKNKKK
jgi:chemosensory pili system protein ChpC